MMFKWLPMDSSANIPAFAHTMIGVGGLVVNDQKQILTIKEKNAIVQGAWKLPGGYVEPGTSEINFPTIPKINSKLIFLPFRRELGGRSNP